MNDKWAVVQFTPKRLKPGSFQLYRVSIPLVVDPREIGL
jgi:hypothetical protein